MAYESFLNSRGLSEVDISTASNNSDGAAQLSANPSTPFSLPYREPSEEVPPAFVSGSHSGSGSIEDTPDLFTFGSRQSRSIWQQSDFNPGTTSESESFDRPFSANPFNANHSRFREKPSTEGSSSSPTLKDNYRLSSKINETPSRFGTSASKGNDRLYTGHDFNFTPSKSDERPYTGLGFGSMPNGHGFDSAPSGHGFGSTPSKCDERPSFGGFSSASSFRDLLNSPTTKSSERLYAGASKAKERPSTAGSVSPSSANDERPSTGGFGSPKTDGRPFSRSMFSLSAPQNTENPFSDKPFGDASPSPQSKNESHQTVDVPLQLLLKTIYGHLPLVRLTYILLKTWNRSIVLKHLSSVETRMGIRAVRRQEPDITIETASFLPLG